MLSNSTTVELRHRDAGKGRRVLHARADQSSQLVSGYSSLDDGVAIPVPRIASTSLLKIKPRSGIC